MYSNQEKHSALDTILKSKTFSKSTTSNVLLKYLVESSIKEEELTASDIGREMFGSKYQHEKSEANVRVNIYHLRKKLQKYYDNEGIDDPIIISIELGQYQVSFSARVLSTPTKRRKLLPLIIAPILVVLALLFLQEQHRTKDKVWYDSFHNSKPTSLYLSPLYGFWGPSQLGTYSFHRNTKINSASDFKALMENHPELKNKYNSDVSNYVTYEDAATIRNYTKLFTSNNQDFTVRHSRDFTTNSLKEDNNIYLSPMRYRTSFSDVFNELSSNLEFVPNDMGGLNLIYHSPETGADSTIHLKTDSKNYECAIVAKLKGGNDTWHYMFFADHGIGLTALSEYFTNKDAIAQFSKEHLKDKQEFVAVYYVSGKDRTNLDMELLFIDAY